LAVQGVADGVGLGVLEGNGGDGQVTESSLGKGSSVLGGDDGVALDILSKKKGGKYLVLQMDEDYTPAPEETRTLYGVQLMSLRARMSPKLDMRSAPRARA
jgi:hypothetical protein